MALTGLGRGPYDNHTYNAYDTRETMASLMLAGLGIAATSVAARFVVTSFKHLQKNAANLPKSPAFVAYYRGGFEPKMSRREAGLILGEFW